MTSYNSKIKRGIMVGLFSTVVLLSGAGLTNLSSKANAETAAPGSTVTVPKEDTSAAAPIGDGQIGVKNTHSATVGGTTYDTLQEAVAATDEANNEITINGTMPDTGTIHIGKKVQLVGGEKATIKAAVFLNDGAQGSTISNIHFDNTDSTAKQIQLWIACPDISVSNNTFELNPGNVSGQYNSVWLTGDADNIKITNNKFTIASPTNTNSWTGINVIGGGINNKLDNIEIINNKLMCPGGTGPSGNRNLVVAIGNVPKDSGNYGIGALKIEKNTVNDYSLKSTISNVHAIIVGNIESLQVTENVLGGYVGLRTLNYKGEQNTSGSITFARNTVNAANGLILGEKANPKEALEVSENTVAPGTDLVKPNADTASIIFKFDDGVNKDIVRVVPKTDNYVEVPDAQRKGYQFGGWYNKKGKVVVNGNQLSLNQFATSKIADTIDEVLTASWVPGMTVPPIDHAPEVSAPTSPTTPTVPTNPTPETEKPTTPQNKVPGNATKVGATIYLTKGAYMYKSADFTNSNRLNKFTKQSRTKRPVFKVVGHTFSKTGSFRYKVTDQNKRSKTYKKTGYITGVRSYSSNLYYTSMPKSKQVRVISSKGISQYKNANLTGRQSHVDKNKTLRVKKMITGNATRYQLTNGNYISANKQLVIWK